jgi:hypothetical protein
VREHDALRITRGARGVQDRGRAVGRDLAPPLLTLVGVRCPELLALLEKLLPGEVRRAGGHRVGVEHHDRTQGRRLLDRAFPARELVGTLEEHDDGSA